VTWRIRQQHPGCRKDTIAAIKSVSQISKVKTGIGKNWNFWRIA